MGWGKPNSSCLSGRKDKRVGRGLFFPAGFRCLQEHQPSILEGPRRSRAPSGERLLHPKSALSLFVRQLRADLRTLLFLDINVSQACLQERSLWVSQWLDNRGHKLCLTRAKECAFLSSARQAKWLHRVNCTKSPCSDCLQVQTRH